MTLFLLLFLFSLCYGQEVIKLDIKKAYQLALNNNPEIRKMLNELSSLEAREVESKLFFLPNIVSGAGLIYNSQRDEWEKPYGISFLSTLYEFRKTISKIRSARLRTEMQMEVKRQFERDLKVTLLELFVQAELLAKLTEVKREEMAIAFVRFDRAVQRKELGFTTDLEVFRLEAVYREKRAELRKAQYEYNQTLYKIKKLVGFKMNDFIELESIQFEPKRGSLDKEKLLSLAKENSSTLKIKRLLLALYDQKLEESNRLFDFRLQLRGEIGNTLRTGAPITKAYSQERWRVGVEIIIPIFDPATPFNLIELGNQKRSLLLEIDDSIKQLELMIHSADYEYSYLISKLDYALAMDKYAEENLTLRKSEYELELAFDLGYAMAEKSESERQVKKAKYEIMLFLAKLYSALGLDPFLVLEGSHDFIKPD
ncbi:TolC family protein [Thermocrinis sp.]